MKEQLKKLRKELNLTQQEFADALHISRNNIASYESGKSNVGTPTVQLICKTFSVNPDWLKSGHGDIFVELEEDAELAEWCSRVLTDEDYETQKRIIQFIKRLDQADIEAVKRVFAIGNQILNEFSNEK